MGIETVPLVLAANEAREIDTAGEYFELRAAVNAVAMVELLDRSGGVGARMANPLESDYVRPRGGFEKVRITNGATPQMIVFVYGSGDAGSRRNSGNVTVQGTVGITGTVDVVDGNKSRTLAAGSFIWRPTNNLGGTMPHSQLWNPLGSGKNLIVDAVILTSSLASPLSLGLYNVALGTAGQTPANELAGSVVPSVALGKVQQFAAPTFSVIFGTLYVPANGTVDFTTLLKRPIVVAPGWGLTMNADTVGAVLSGGVSFFEA